MEKAPNNNNNNHEASEPIKFENIKNREQKYSFLEDVPNWEDKLAAYDHLTRVLESFEKDENEMLKYGHADGKMALPTTADYIDILFYDKEKDIVSLLPRKAEGEKNADLQKAA